MDITDQATAGAVALGITAAIRQTGWVPDKALPFCSLVIAVIVAMGMASSWTFESGLSGVIAGLSASGLWSSGRAVTGK